MFFSGTLAWILLFLSIFSGHARTVYAQEPEDRRLAWLDDAVAGYIYGVAPVEMYRTMQQMVVTGENAVFTGGFNRYHHSSTLATAGDRWVVAPNNDTLYSNAWLDLSNGPVLLHVPDTGERYYVLQLMDMYTNNFALLGTRTGVNGARTYRVSGPDWEGETPPGMEEVRAPGNLVWVLGRIHIKNRGELEEVRRLQKQFRIEPMNAGNFQLPVIYDPARSLNFYRVLDAVLEEAPPPGDDEPLLEQLRRIGIGTKEPFEPDLLPEWQKKVLQEAEIIARANIAEQAGKYTPLGKGWVFDGEHVGRFGTDYLTRAATTLTGLGVLNVEEAFYPFVTVDIEGRPLKGGHNYRLSFNRDDLSRARFFWSLTAYQLPEWSLIDNPANRYSLSNSSTELHYDGNVLNVMLQATQPKSPGNWLPVPERANFALVLRLYGPRPGMWRDFRPPGVRRLD